MAGCWPVYFNGCLLFAQQQNQQKQSHVTFCRGSGGIEPLPPHSDALDWLKATCWLILSNRYCVTSGPCRITENMARNITGSTVTGYLGSRHPQQQVVEAVVVVVAAGFSSGRSQSSAAGQPSSVSASESRLRILVVSGSFMSSEGKTPELPSCSCRV